MTARAGRWGLRFLAFFGAVIIWWFASVEERERISEKVIDASVTYNSPQGLVLLDPVQSVQVRLRGPDSRVRAVVPFAVDVVVDIPSDQPGTITVQLEPENVLTPEEVEVAVISPNVLELRLDRVMTRDLPVWVRLVGEPAGGAVPGEPRAIPGRARVRGPESLVSSLSAVSTSPISLDGHALDFSQTAALVSSDPLVRVVAPAFVTVEIPMITPPLPGDEELTPVSDVS